MYCDVHKRYVHHLVCLEKRMAEASAISKDGSPYYIGIGMVPSIIGVWGYDREFCSSSPPSSSPSRVTQKPNKYKVMKFCKNVDIHNAKRLHIFIFGSLI